MTHTQANEPGFVLVPREPTREMWSGLARDIVMWTRFGGRPTGATLHAHIRHLGRPIPDWLLGLISDDDMVPPKGAVAFAIYRAMLAAAPIVPAPAYEVKELVWQSFEDIHWAESLVGTYNLVQDGLGQWHWTGDKAYEPANSGAEGIELSIDEAKAAAQADFERRILSCLSSAPVEEADAKAGEGLFLIRKRGAYYRPNEQGYTSSTVEAGRYSRADAERITHPNGLEGPRDGMDYVPAPPASTIPSEPEAKGEAGAGPSDLSAELQDELESCITGTVYLDSAGTIMDAPMAVEMILDVLRRQVGSVGEAGAGPVSEANDGGGAKEAAIVLRRELAETRERLEKVRQSPAIDGLSLAAATALVELFGGEETDMTVQFIENGHSGSGFYAWCTEYPEDGSDYLGPASEFSHRAALSTQESSAALAGGGKELGL